MSWAAGTLAHTIPLWSAVSASAVFDVQRRRAYFVTLKGTVLAFTVQAPELASPGLQQQDTVKPEMGIHHVWEHAGPAAIFSAPAIVAASGIVIYAAADGSVSALSCSGKLPIYAVMQDQA